MIHYITEILKHTQNDTSESHVPFHKNHEKTLITCPICYKTIRGGRSPSFKNTASLTKHILRVHQSEKNLKPTFSDVFLVLEKIATTLEDKIPIDTIPEVRELNMSVK